MQTSLRRIGLLAIAGSLSLTALLAVVVLLTADFNRGSVNILATTALVALFSLIALPGAVLLDRGCNRPLAWTSLGLVLVAFLLLEGQVWEAGPGWRARGLALIWAFILAETAMLEARRREPESRAASIAFWAATQDVGDRSDAHDTTQHGTFGHAVHDVEHRPGQDQGDHDRERRAIRTLERGGARVERVG